MSNTTTGNRIHTRTATTAWHQLDLARCAEQLTNDTALGLSHADAESRLMRYGPTQLAQTQPRSPWLKLLDQFKNLLVLVFRG